MDRSQGTARGRWAAGSIFVLLAVMLALIAPVSALGADSPVIAGGAVTDADTGLPVADARISATYLYPDVEGEAFAGEAWTAADGTYTLVDAGGYGASQYRFQVSAPGYVPQYVERPWDGVTPLALDFALAPVRTVAVGTVTDADTGLPIEGASVTVSRHAYEFEYDIIGSDDTAANGSFTILDPFGYGAGDCGFSIYADGYVFQVHEAYWDGTTPLEIDFALVPPRTIAAGAVTDAATGLPVAGAYVRAWWFDGAIWCPSWTAFSAADGSYVVREAESVHGFGEAGAWRFDVTASAYLSRSAYATWDGITPLAIDFALTPDTPPVATVDAYTTAKNTTLRVAAPGVLANDADADGDALTAVKLAGVSSGTLTLSADGSFVYVPKKNWTGVTSFTYRAYDGTYYSNTVTVTITVNATKPGRH